MKKVTLFFAIILTTLTAKSQEYGFSIGPKVGIATTTLTNTLEGTSDSYLSWIPAIQADYRFNESFSLSMEANYVRVGAENDANQSYLYLDYINLPIMARFFPVGGLNIFAGPEVGFLTSSQANGMNAESVFKTMNFAFTGGIGYRFNGGLTIDARYSGGLTDVSEYFVAKTSILSLSVGYLF